MSERFGDDWAQFVALIPDWEVQLAGLTKSEIYDQVDALEGLNPLQVLPMSLALFDIVASLAQRFVSSLRVSSFDKILALAESIANDPHYGLHRDDAFERPFRVRPSWEDDAWFRTLLQGRAKLQGLKGDTGGPQILGVSAGAGEGKSHRLMQLQRFRPTKFRSEVKTVTDVEAQLVDVPDVDRFVDITYGLGQGLEFDRKYLGKGIYLRLLLRSMGMSNKGEFERLYVCLLTPDHRLLARIFASGVSCDASSSLVCIRIWRSPAATAAMSLNLLNISVHWLAGIATIARVALATPPPTACYYRAPPRSLLMGWRSAACLGATFTLVEGLYHHWLFLSLRHNELVCSLRVSRPFLAIRFS